MQDNLAIILHIPYSLFLFLTPGLKAATHDLWSILFGKNGDFILDLLCFTLISSSNTVLL